MIQSSGTHERAKEKRVQDHGERGRNTKRKRGRMWTRRESQTPSRTEQGSAKRFDQPEVLRMRSMRLVVGVRVWVGVAYESRFIVIVVKRDGVAHREGRVSGINRC